MFLKRKYGKNSKVWWIESYDLNSTAYAEILQWKESVWLIQEGKVVSHLIFWDDKAQNPDL